MFGGLGDWDFQRAVEAYDPDTEAWTDLSPMGDKVKGVSAAFVPWGQDGHIIVPGGYGGPGNSFSNFGHNPSIQHIS